ncbi:unnamed protein product [Polarella glacialis]|uniref:Uncharacterized protein n=1 Tax=Polarella glacialis TaxID=89957 RepID=A0A813GAB2_POLGL|nr:unnamed protein product [Polarella glacialis]
MATALGACLCAMQLLALMAASLAPEVLAQDCMGGGCEVLTQKGGEVSDSSMLLQMPAKKQRQASVDKPACLCVFDIDRTLTGKQGDTKTCPDNKELPGITDWAYGGGTATLSALSAAGINSTWCNDCFLGICSAGAGSGKGSPWNNYILDNIMRGAAQDSLTKIAPEIKRWSHGTDNPFFNFSIVSPYVLSVWDSQKSHAVEAVRQWYLAAHGIQIDKENVHFFDDRTDNEVPFGDVPLNAAQISKKTEKITKILLNLLCFF